MKHTLFFLCATSFLYTQPPHPKKLYESLNVHVAKDSSWVQKLNEWGTLSQPTCTLPSVSKHQCVLPLFQHYPGLSVIPYVDICNLPTPVQKLTQVITMDGVELYIKLDGLSAHPYGGNKARKFAFEIGRALKHGAKTVITFGCVASNHAVTVSEHIAQLRRDYGIDLKAICMLKPQPNSSVVRKNLLLHLTNGAELHYYPDNDTRRIGTIEKWQDHKNIYGDYPYIIPTGGSTPTGTIGFVNASFELAKQIQDGLLPEPDYIYVPFGSSATSAGLILGCKAAGLKTKVIAIATEPEEYPGEFYQNVIALFHQTNALLHETDPSFALLDLKSDDFIINLDFTGTEYGLFTPECIHARELLMNAQNIITEGTYTAKAFAALLHDVLNKKVKGNILFWNTYCGSEFEDRLAKADYKQLPVCFHRYFEEDVQELDKTPSSFNKGKMR